MSSPLYSDQILGKIYRSATNTIGTEVIAQALPLPNGAATEAKQDTGNASLADIDSKVATAANQATELLALGSIDTSLANIESAGATATKQDTGNASLSSIDTKLTSQATAAKQDTGNASLASIDGKLNSLGQKTMSASVPIVIASNQSPVPFIEADSMQFDSFHRERSSIARTIFNSSHQLSKEPEKWDESITGSGASSTYTANTASIDMVVGTTNGEIVIRQTRRAFHYVPGYSRIALMTFVFGAAKTNLRQRAGNFDPDNGVYLEQTGSTINMVLRSKITGSAVDTPVAKADWNVDKFDGSGPSGVTLDLTKAQIWFVDLQWLGVGRVRTGFIVNGLPYVAHEFKHANLISSVYTPTANWHCRLEIENLGAVVSASTLKHMCCTIIIEGGDRDLIGNLRTANTGITVINTVKNQRNCLIAIRSSVHTTTIKPLKMSMDYTTTDDILWELIFNATITGGAWVSNSDYTEKNISATAISGGTVLDSGYFNANASVLSFNYTFDDGMGLYLGHSIAMVFDTIALSVNPVGKAGTALAAISYKEIY